MNPKQGSLASSAKKQQKVEVVQRVGMVTSSSRKIQRTSQQVSQTNTPIKSQSRQSQSIMSSVKKTEEKAVVEKQKDPAKMSTPRYSRTSGGSQSVSVFEAGKSAKKLLTKQETSQSQLNQSQSQPQQSLQKKKQAAKKSIARIAQRHARYKLIDGFNGLRLNYYKTSITGYKTVKLLDIGKKIVFRWKNHAWMKLLQNRNISRKREQACRKVVFLMNMMRLKLNRNVIQRMRGNSLVIKSRQSISVDQTPSKRNSRTSQAVNNNMASSKSLKVSKQSENTQGSLIEKMVLSQQAIAPLKKCVRYDRRSFYELSTTELRQAFEAQKKRLQLLKNSDKSLRNKQFDNQLFIVVLLNHVTCLLHFNQDKQKLEKRLQQELQKEKDKPLSTNTLASSPQGGSFNTGIARKYELAAKQIQASDEEIKGILDQKQTDYDQLVRVLRAQVHRLKKNKNDKLISSRIHLSEIIINLVANLSKGEVPSHKQITQHHYVQLVDQLVNKVKQLSTISQQIPQLQTFKRNLDLTQVSHQEHFIRIVDVLIALHHRVNQLLRLRPEDMMNVIDNYRNQCRNIDSLTTIFIQTADSQAEELQAIVFNSKKGTHIEQFYPIHKNITSMSKLLIKQRDYCIKSQEIIQRLKVVVQIFWNVMSGLKSFERQWRIAKANNDVSDVEKQILLILDQCLEIFNDRMIVVQRRAKEAEDMLQRKKNETSLYHEKLQTEINALLSDFQSVTLKNQELEQFANRLMNQKEQLANELRLLKNSNAKSPKHQKNKKSNAQYDILEKQNEDLRASVAKLQSQIKRKSREGDKSSREKTSQLQRRISLLQDQNQHLQKQRDLNKSKINQLNQQLIITKQEIDSRGYQIQRLNRSLQAIRLQYSQFENKSRAAIRELENKNIELNNYSQSLRQQMKIMQSNHQRIIQRIQHTSTTVISNNNQASLINNQQFGKLQGRLNILLNDQLKYKAQLARLRQENIQLNKRLDQQWSNQSAVSQLNIIVREKYSLEQRLRISAIQIEQLKKKIDVFWGQNTQNLTQIQSALKQKEYELKTLKAENQANLSKIRTLNMIIEQNKAGNNPQLLKQLQILRVQLRDFLIFKQQNQSYRTKFIKDEAYILYLQEQVRSLQDVVNILSQQQNTLSEKYSMLSAKLRYISQGKLLSSDSAKDQEIQRLRMQISELRSSSIRRVTQHTQIIHHQQSSANNNSEENVNSLKASNVRLNQTIRDMENDFKKRLEGMVPINEINLRERNFAQRESQLNSKILLLQNSLRTAQASQQQQSLSSQIRDMENDFKKRLEGMVSINEINLRERNFAQREYQLNSKIVLLQNNLRIAQASQKHQSSSSQIQILQTQLRTLSQEIRMKDLELFDQRTRSQNIEIDIKQRQEEIMYLRGQIQNWENNFAHMQQDLLNQIERLRQALNQANNSISTKQIQRIQVNRGEFQNIPINGYTLDQLIETTDMDNQQILDKINEIVRANTISYDLQRVMPPQLRKDVEGFIITNQNLIDLAVNLTSDRERMLSVLRNYPNPEHLTEFLFRTLIGFAGIPDLTLQSDQVMDTLFGIRESRRGGEYFVGLEQFVNAFFEHDVLPRRLNMIEKPVTETHHKVTVVRSQPYDHQQN